MGWRQQKHKRLQGKPIPWPLLEAEGPKRDTGDNPRWS